MKIIVDADACPVTRIVEKIAKEFQIPVTLISDTSHIIESDYCEIITVDKGSDSADFKIITIGNRGDIVITQDYGVAAMSLGKGMYCIHQSGKEYTNDNIDGLLAVRHIKKKARNSSGKKHFSSSIPKRTIEDDETFTIKFKELLERLTTNGK